MEYDISGYNMDHKDELLLVDFRASLQMDMQKAMAEMKLYASVIRTITSLGIDCYLHDAYVMAGNRYADILTEWNKWFPGQQAIRLVGVINPVVTFW